MEIQVKLTIKEICEKGQWKTFCELTGWDEWCVEDGQMSMDDEMIISKNIAKQLGFWED